MSAERTKILWISAVVAAFALVIAIAGVLLFAPTRGGAAAPASVGNRAAPKALDPQDYLATPPPAPLPTEELRRSDGDIIVIYGDKPAELPPTGPGLAPPTASQPGVTGTPLAAAPAASTGSTAVSAPIQTAPVVTPQAAPQAMPQAPAPAPKPAAPKPAPTTKTSTPTKTAAKPAAPVEEYWIQAASFSSRGRADELREVLAAKGIAALITVKDIDGKSYYRVRIGPYGKRAEADSWLAKIKTVAGCGEAYVTKAIR